jgi:subtilase family serine protease
MQSSLKLVAPLIAALAIAACSGGASSIPAKSTPFQSIVRHGVPQWQVEHLARAACPQIAKKPTCLALISNTVPAACSPSGGGCGFVPTDLQTRYNLTPYLGNGSGKIVAVIDAGDDPTASSDLAEYRSQFGLGTANLIKYNEDGLQKNYPPSCDNYGFCLETALDIEMVSASCPLCTIYLIETKGPINDFEKAEASAVKLGATIVSNSWICYGDWKCGDRKFPKYFRAKHVTFLAGSGDFGENEIGGPSVLDSVVAVGGTQITKSGSTYSESVWDDAGGGCATPSAVGGKGVPKPKWQDNSGCNYRSDADVSAQAGCSPGVAEYSSQYEGWVDTCGTSVATPLLAGIYALTGNAKKHHTGKKFWEAQFESDLYDACASSCLFDTYSYQGGWGSPDGIGAL